VVKVYYSIYEPYILKVLVLTIYKLVN